MTAEVDVANRALYLIGDSRISALLENSKRAQVCNEFFANLRDALLSRYNWQFAVTRASIAASATAPDWGFTLAYPLPSDYLALIQANEFYAAPSLNDYRTSDDRDWVVESNQILTNWSSPLKIRYVRRVTDPNQWSALFIEALSQALAIKLQRPLAGKADMRELRSDYQETLDMALMRNEIESPPEVIADDSWILGRLA